MVVRIINLIVMVLGPGRGVLTSPFDSLTESATASYSWK